MAFRAEQVLSFDEGFDAAARLAARLGIPCQRIEVHIFPDDERRVTVPACGRHVAVYRPLDRPNTKLIELLLAASAIRDRGATDICLIAPYLPYMRQDIAFHDGEAVSQRVLGQVMAAAFDRFVTVDPHLHRTPHLSQIFGGKPALALSAGAAIARHVGADAVILGPDEESETLVRAVAEPAGLAWRVARKERHGDRQVEIRLPGDSGLAGRRAVIVDDIITSGTTIMELVRIARRQGAVSVDVFTTHAMHPESASHAFAGEGVATVISCDGIPHPTNKIELAETLATGLETWR